MRYQVTLGDRTVEVDIEGEGDRIVVDGDPVAADLSSIDGTRVHSLLLDGSSYRISANRRGRGRWELYVRGSRVVAEVADERTLAIRELTGTGAAPGGPTPLRAPMPGLVVKIEVSEGDWVEAGQGLVIVEAMKMENELTAVGPGRVEKIHVSEGEAVEKDQPLIDFEAPDGPEEA